jgi:nicotinamidase-related amidase
MKKLLIVVDYQNDFVTGSLGFPEAKKIEPLLVNKIQTYIKEKQDIVFTMDTHQADYLETLEGKRLPVEHTMVNTEG